MQHIGFTYEFFPVGQGLFSHGTLRSRHRELPFFQWVYDCGTVSGPIQENLDHALDIMADRSGGNDRLNLLFISHFDRDHIEGIPSLLSRYRSVDTIVLPYVSFERLVLFAVEGAIDSNDPVFQFFTDPVGYLTSQETQIDRILFVLPSGGSGTVTTDSGEPKMPGSPQSELEISGATSPPDGAEYVQKGHPRTVREFLAPGGKITVTMFWEFVPYNDDLGVDISETWVARVTELRDELAAGASIEERSLALYELKKEYREQFGANKQNELSLFLYSGPLPARRTLLLDMRVDMDLYPAGAERRHAYVHHHDMGRASILYTGDGTLKARQRLQRMIEYFGQSRIERCAVFQVMHHGSRHNWHAGLAASITPCFSIFSSDPDRGRTYHPHAEVVRDFLPYCPIQVNQHTGCRCEGWLHWRPHE